METHGLPGPWPWGHGRSHKHGGHDEHGGHGGHGWHGGHRFDDARMATAEGRGGWRHGGPGGPGGSGHIPPVPPGFGFGFGPGFGSGGPGFFGGRGRGRGPKVRRGDVRAAILALLAEAPMHGYQMINELAERSQGAWRPSPGSVYPVLALLTDEGLVRAEENDGKRVFHLTDAGRAHTDARAGEPRPWDTAAAAADEGLTDLRSLAFGVGAAVMQVAQAGSDAQIKAAQGILTDTRRALYRILADDEPDEPDEPMAEDGRAL
ncbi:PadR family transcriptional regulator [Frankia sp. Cr2]|uniref:PadR family transcriptional regulator n=1 Tax=Frankia sp. Cr2 TaxID=3073932 RepID=UPI002AD2D28E|nr:PadR family transcriptional regulator [Frankia sp. Cr2]